MSDLLKSCKSTSAHRGCDACGNWKHNCICPLVNFAPEVESGPERISVAAISFEGVVYALPRPGRHHNIFRLMKALGVPPPRGKEEQGFLTSEGRFVDREEGKLIAVAQGQLIPRASKTSNLFSECVW